MRWSFLSAGLLASVAAGTGAAVAADYYPPRPLPPPQTAAAATVPPATPPYISEWTGFYAGINGGGGRSHTTIDPGEFEFGETQFVFPNLSGSGGVFGGQFGHNWQWGPVVGGLEVDFDWADLKDSTNFFQTEAGVLQNFNQDFKIDALASVRGRLGYLIWPNWLLYGTAGIAWAHTRFTLNQTFLTFNETNTIYTNEFGWVAGAGLEWKLADHWFLRGEWLHYDFGRNTLPNLVAPATGVVDEDNFSFRNTVDIGRAALSYRF
jgi:outer membrane immunogenic protein